MEVGRMFKFVCSRVWLGFADVYKSSSNVDRSISSLGNEPARLQPER